MDHCPAGARGSHFPGYIYQRKDAAQCETQICNRTQVSGTRHQHSSSLSALSLSIMADFKEPAGQRNVDIALAEEVAADAIMTDKIKHGDEALKFMTEHDGEAVTPEEEKKVLRKIDFRLLPIMMLLNTLQLVDKNVSATMDKAATVLFSLWIANPVFLSADTLHSSCLRPRDAGQTRGTAVLAARIALLHRIPCRRIPFQLPDAEAAHRQVSDSQRHTLGHRPRLCRCLSELRGPRCQPLFPRCL